MVMASAAHHLAAVRSQFVLPCPVQIGHLVGVLILRDQPVDDGNRQHASEEGEHRYGIAAAAQGRGQSLLTLGKELHHRYIQHNSGREAKADAEKTGIGLPGKICDQSADAGTQSSDQRHAYRKKFMVHGQILLFYLL